MKSKLIISSITIMIIFLASCQFENSLLEEVDSQLRQANGETERELGISASGNGTVNPSGLITITEKDLLDISAVPDSGYSFLRWEKVGGDGTVSFGDFTQASTTVNLKDGNAAIEAVFTADSYTLTVQNDGNGSTTPTGVVSVDHGVERSINASPATGYEFVNWTVTSGNADILNPSSASTTVTLSQGDAGIRANFQLIEYSITLQNDGNGSTSPSGQSTVDYNTPYTIRAYPDRFYSFSGWTQSGGSGNVAFTDASDRYTEIRVTGGDVSIRANFVQSTYDLDKRGDLELNTSGYPDSVSDMKVDGDYLYLSGQNNLGEGTVMRIDVSNILSPSVSSYVDTTTGSGYVNGIAINGSYVFAADRLNGLYRFDKTLSSSSKFADTSNGGIDDVAIHGNNSSKVLAIGYDTVYEYESSTGSLSDQRYATLNDPGNRIISLNNYAFVSGENGDSGIFYAIDAGASQDREMPILDTYTSAFSGFGEYPKNMAVFEGEVVYTLGFESLVGIYIDGLPTSLSEAVDQSGIASSPVDLDFGYFSDDKTYYKSLLVTASASSGSSKYSVIDIAGAGSPSVVDIFDSWHGEPEAMTIAGDYLYTVEIDTSDTVKIVIYKIVVDP